MSLHHCISAGLVGDKLSRTITRTNRVSAERSAIATGSGALLTAAGPGAVAAVASVLGAGAVTAVAAPAVIPAAVIGGAVAFVSSLWE